MYSRRDDRETEALSRLIAGSRHDGAMAPKPRSLILDLFGEYLRFADAQVRLGHLTTLLGDFDVSAATVRVTMSRLRREDWFTSEREGRETIYRLSDEMLGVLREGRTRIFAEPTRSWDGGWTMVIYQLSEDERQEREQLRKQLAWHGFGSLTTSTWLAPGDRRAVARELVGHLQQDRADVVRCTTDGPEQDHDFTKRCWDLDELASDYQVFLAEHDELQGRAPKLTGADALVARTVLISHYRHFPFRDPQLPPELLPKGWPGDAAYKLFRTAHAELGPAARKYVGEVIGRPVDDPETSPLP
jgi:phenylacetic acid degradation operon negative regulatory protein